MPSCRRALALVALAGASCLAGAWGCLAKTNGAPSGPADGGSAPVDASVDDVAAEASQPEGSPSGDACGDSQADPRNCGACGHDCGSSPCNQGVCGTPPHVLASAESPTFVAVDATSVYWVSAKPPPSGASGDSQVMSCVIGGCASPAITWAGFYGLGGLAVSGGTLFWPAGQGPAGDAGALGSSPQIMSCPTNGCTAAATVASVNDNITTFAIDGPNAFWTVKSGSIESCPLTGCGGAPLVLASQQAMPWGIAVDSTSVYWTNVDDGTVLSCPRSGCTGGPSILASGQQRPTAVAAFAGNVYWINLGLPNGGGKQPVTSYAGGSVMKCSVAGSGSQPVALFAYPTWLGGAAIAADSSNVYWSMEDSSGKFGEIVKCSSAGCASGPSGIGTTSTNHDPTVGLALDAANVYWSDPGAGAILTAGK